MKKRIRKTKKSNIKINRNIVIYVIVVIALILLLVGLIVFLSLGSSKKKGEKIKIGKNNYIIDTTNTYKDATIITNDELKKEHCVDDVCIKDLTIYYFNDYNNIELDIINKGNDSVTGYMKVVFEDLERTVHYTDLEKNGKQHYVIQLGDKKVENIDDFKVRKLTAKEEKEIKG